MPESSIRFIDMIAGMPCFGAPVKESPIGAEIDRIKELPHAQQLEEMRKIKREEIDKWRRDLEHWRMDPSLGFGREIRERVNDCGIAIIADDAAQWLKDHYDPKDFSFSDIPNVTPPFRRFWIEARELDGHFGFFCESIDLKESKTRRDDIRERWKSTIISFFCKKGRTEVIGQPDIEFTVDELGRFVKPPTVLEKGERALDLFEHFGLGILLSAISFIHCKNIVLTDLPAPAKLNKARVRKGNLPLVRVKTLRIEPMKQILRAEGRLGENGIRKAMHICRGHFKRFSTEKPLFGKHAGMFWWPQTVRGSAESGVVVKDYAIGAPKEVQT